MAAPLIAVSHFLNTALTDLRERPPEQASLRDSLAQIDALLVQAINLVAPLVRHDSEYIPYHGPRELGFTTGARTDGTSKGPTDPPLSPLTSQGGRGGGVRAKPTGPITLRFKQDLDDLLK